MFPRKISSPIDVLLRRGTAVPSVRFRGVALVAVVAVALAGCSTVDSMFGSDDPPAGSAQQEEGRPNLARVPGQRPATTSEQEREVIYQGLYADRSNARHVDGPVAQRSTEDLQGQQTASLEGARIITPQNAQDVEVAEARQRQFRQIANRLGLQVGSGGFVGRIQFTPGETALPAGSGRQILQIARFHRAVGGNIVIVGHTKIHPTGEQREARAELSRARANAVANGFRSLGISQDDLRVSGRGDQQPRTRSQENDARNSRVDIFIRNVPGL